MKSISSSFLVLVCTLLVTACGGGDDVPLSTAAEVKAAYDAAPSTLESWYAQSKEEQGDVVMMQYRPDFTLQEPFRLVVFYQGPTIYDERRWGISESHAVMSDGTDVLLITEYGSPRDRGTSVVFIDGVKVPKLQSLPVRIGNQDYPATVRDIREYQDGWLILFATLDGQGGYGVYRFAMYHPKTGDFVDCGELGYNRHPDWGPPASSVCRYR